MGEPIQYRPMEPSEQAQVSRLVLSVFEEFVAPLYREQGREIFRSIASPEALLERSQGEHMVLVALEERELVGVIGLRDYRHISLLFVDGRHQGRGISRELVRRSVVVCRSRRPELRQVSVNASPNSVAAYEAMGFRPTDTEREAGGLRFTPLVLDLVPERGA